MRFSKRLRRAIMQSNSRFNTLLFLAQLYFWLAVLGFFIVIARASLRLL